MGTDVLVFMIGATAVITGITQALKATGLLSVNWAAIFEVALGIVLFELGVASGALVVTGVAPGGPTYFFAAVYGCISGLTAAGLYTDAKRAVEAGRT